MTHTAHFSFSYWPAEGSIASHPKIQTSMPSLSRFYEQLQNCTPCHSSTRTAVTSHFHSLSGPVCFPSGPHSQWVIFFPLSTQRCFLKCKTESLKIWFYTCGHHQLDEVIDILQMGKTSVPKWNDLTPRAGFLKHKINLKQNLHSLDSACDPIIYITFDLVPNDLWNVVPMFCVSSNRSSPKTYVLHL